MGWINLAQNRDKW